MSVPEFALGPLLKHLPIFNASRDVVEPKRVGEDLHPWALLEVAVSCAIDLGLQLVVMPRGLQMRDHLAHPGVAHDAIRIKLSQTLQALTQVARMSLDVLAPYPERQVEGVRCRWVGSPRFFFSISGSHHARDIVELDQALSNVKGLHPGLVPVIRVWRRWLRTQLLPQLVPVIVCGEVLGREFHVTVAHGTPEILVCPERGFQTLRGGLHERFPRIPVVHRLHQFREAGLMGCIAFHGRFWRRCNPRWLGQGWSRLHHSWGHLDGNRLYGWSLRLAQSPRVCKIQWIFFLHGASGQGRRLLLQRNAGRGSSGLLHRAAGRGRSGLLKRGRRDGWECGRECGRQCVDRRRHAVHCLCKVARGPLLLACEVIEQVRAL
mmetsp:Transcript_8242/g.22834  ORF Transcript_8242/g.22834 Transcript_8242/m.22834 type:complete len:377 (+) Transcript_8242:15-1145(+)